MHIHGWVDVSGCSPVEHKLTHTLPQSHLESPEPVSDESPLGDRTLQLLWMKLRAIHEFTGLPLWVGSQYPEGSQSQIPRVQTG